MMLPKTSACVKSYDGQTIFLLKMMTYQKNKVSADIKKEFDSKPVYNKNYLKTKIKSYGDEVTDFYNKKISKLDSNHTCLAVISLDSTLRKDGTYYPKVYLNECKYIEKKVEKKEEKNIHDNLSDFSFYDESDEEQIKAITLMVLVNVFLEGAILKEYNEE